jgi:hypothetical protein
MNPGIVKLVALLQANGFSTTDSGDGETHEFECDRDYGYVVITVEPTKMVEESDRLCAVLAQYGITVVEISEQEAPCIQASYDPVTKSAFIDLMYVHDKLLNGSPGPAN